jgi:putative acetyltransferase
MATNVLPLVADRIFMAYFYSYLMNSVYNIRPISASDDESVRDIIQSSILEYGAPKVGTAYSDEATQRMSKHYRGDHECYFVLTRDDKVMGGAGIAHLENAPADYGELQKMYFIPEVRGKGLGSKMMDTCIAFAKAKSYRFLYIETMTNMVEAQKLYRKYGFLPLKKPLGNTGHYNCPVQMLLDIDEA